MTDVVVALFKFVFFRFSCFVVALFKFVLFRFLKIKTIEARSLEQAKRTCNITSIY